MASRMSGGKSARMLLIRADTGEIGESSSLGMPMRRRPILNSCRWLLVHPKAAWITSLSCWKVKPVGTSRRRHIGGRMPLRVTFSLAI